MFRYRNFWVYSAGLAVAWVIVFILVTALRGSGALPLLWLVFGGFCIGWVSTTIARYVYPPPAKWTAPRRI